MASNNWQARLDQAVQKLKDAKGWGENGHDWLVKENARLVQEASVIEAGARERQGALLDVHLKVSYIHDWNPVCADHRSTRGYIVAMADHIRIPLVRRGVSNLYESDVGKR